MSAHLYMRRRTLSRDESTPLLTMEQTPPTKEKLDVQSDDAVVNGKHVVFGKVTSGAETIRAMAAVGSQSGATSQPVRIVDSGAC